MASTILSPLVQEVSFHGPEPIATVVPKPCTALLESQMIEEKLSARKGMSATNGLSSLSFTVERIDDLDPGNRPPARLRDARVRGIEGTFDGVLDVLRVERRAVMTGDAVLQREGVLLAVRARRPGLGEVRNRLPVLVGGEQRVEDQAPNLEGQGARRAMRIEGIDVTVAGPDDVLGGDRAGRDPEPKGREHRRAREAERGACHGWSPFGPGARCRRTCGFAAPERDRAG